MAESDDIAVGKYVLDQGILTQDALLDCLFETIAERRGERSRAFPRPLGVLLLERGLITPAHLTEALRARFGNRPGSWKLSDLPIGDLLVSLGYAKREHIAEALSLQETTQKEGGPRPRIGEILVERGYITAEHVARALAYQLKEIYRCTRCALRVNLHNPQAAEDNICQRCGGILIPAEAGAIGVHESRTVPPRPAARAPAESVFDETGQFTVPFSDAHQAEIDRAAYVYIRQRGMARRETLRHARRIQMEVARYGISVPLVEVLRRINAISWQQFEALQRTDFEAMILKPDWHKQDIPGYRLLERIADGGFGIIYTAQPVFGQHRVAIKVLRPERSDAGSVGRLKREAALLRRLSHENLIRGIEYGRHQKSHYLVMEYFESVSLAQAIAERRAFAPQLARHIVRQIASALEYLQREGYIHRDIKPDNILLAPSGMAKICDLGFATEIGGGEPHTPRASTVGTQGYMSPEQTRGDRDLGIGTDIYALGITLYAMLAGFEPFSGASSEVMAAEYVEGGLPAPDLTKIRAPRSMLELVRHMTLQNREQRFSTYPALIEAIERAVV